MATIAADTLDGFSGRMNPLRLPHDLLFGTPSACHHHLLGLHIYIYIYILCIYTCTYIATSLSLSLYMYIYVYIYILLWSSSAAFRSRSASFGARVIRKVYIIYHVTQMSYYSQILKLSIIYHMTDSDSPWHNTFELLTEILLPRIARQGIVCLIPTREATKTT